MNPAFAMDALAINDARLHGVFCTNVDEAVAAARAGADLLAMRRALGLDELAGLCGLVPVPVAAYVPERSKNAGRLAPKQHTSDWLGGASNANVV
jgi:hypothetical protein